MDKIKIDELITEDIYLTSHFTTSQYQELLQLGVNEKITKWQKLHSSYQDYFHTLHQRHKDARFSFQGDMIQTLARSLYEQYKQYDKIQATIIASGCIFSASDETLIEELWKIITYDELSSYSQKISDLKRKNILQAKDLLLLERICQRFEKRFQITDYSFIANKILQLLAFQKEIFLKHNVLDDLNLDMVYTAEQYQEVDTERYFSLKQTALAMRKKEQKNKEKTDITHRCCCLYHNRNLTSIENAIIAANYGLDSLMDFFIELQLSSENIQTYSNMIRRVKNGKAPTKVKQHYINCLQKLCYFIYRKTGIKDFSLILNRLNQIYCFEKNIDLEKEQTKNPK